MGCLDVRFKEDPNPRHHLSLACAVYRIPRTVLAAHFWVHVCIPCSAVDPPPAPRVATKNILFVFSGAFTQLDATIRKRRAKTTSFGFACDDVGSGGDGAGAGSASGGGEGGGKGGAEGVGRILSRHLTKRDLLAKNDNSKLKKKPSSKKQIQVLPSAGAPAPAAAKAAANGGIGGARMPARSKTDPRD